MNPEDLRERLQALLHGNATYDKVAGWVVGASKAIVGGAQALARDVREDPREAYWDALKGAGGGLLAAGFRGPEALGAPGGGPGGILGRPARP